MSNIHQIYKMKYDNKSGKWCLCEHRNNRYVVMMRDVNKSNISIMMLKMYRDLSIVHRSVPTISANNRRYIEQCVNW